MTLASLACATISMVATLQQNYGLASAVILLAVVTDGMDGHVARLASRSSIAGEQLDSLADVVAFGAAPALLIYASFLQQFPVTGTIVAVALVLASAFRLAHFHPEPSQPYFIGLPTTAVGATLATLPFLGASFPPMVIALVVLALGYLMLTTLRFPKVGLLCSALPRPVAILMASAVAALYATHTPLVCLAPVAYITASLAWNRQMAGERIAATD